MKVGRNKVVKFDYELRNRSGDMLGTSNGSEGVSYLHGHGQIVPGLEHALDGVEEGETVEVTVDPQDAYGDKDPEKVFKVPRGQIPPHIPLKPGIELVADDGMGHAIHMRVHEVGEDFVVLDANHPLAGELLDFKVKIVDVREASADEILHGHVHGGEPQE